MTLNQTNATLNEILMAYPPENAKNFASPVVGGLPVAVAETGTKSLAMRVGSAVGTLATTGARMGNIIGLGMMAYAIGDMAYNWYNDPSTAVDIPSTPAVITPNITEIWVNANEAVQPPPIAPNIPTPEQIDVTDYDSAMKFLADPQGEPYLNDLADSYLDQLAVRLQNNEIASTGNQSTPKPDLSSLKPAVIQNMKDTANQAKSGAIPPPPVVQAQKTTDATKTTATALDKVSKDGIVLKTPTVDGMPECFPIKICEETFIRLETLLDKYFPPAWRVALGAIIPAMASLYQNSDNINKTNLVQILDKYFYDSANNRKSTTTYSDLNFFLEKFFSTGGVGAGVNNIAKVFEDVKINIFAETMKDGEE